MSIDVNKELSAKNKKLIEEWDRMIRIKKLNISLDENNDISVKVKIQDSPFENVLSSGDVDLEAIPKFYRTAFIYIVNKIVSIIENNINDEGEMIDGKKTNV